MSRVITLSRTFPKGHSRAGDSTNFVEKSLVSIGISACDLTAELQQIVDMRTFLDCNPKHHTIRAGKRWKTGDKASLRVWSGLPYRSKQIAIAPDVELVVKDMR